MDKRMICNDKSPSRQLIENQSPRLVSRRASTRPARDIEARATPRGGGHSREDGLPLPVRPSTFSGQTGVRK